ncbi:MAG: efflux RND transporter periplasmic adaptor subunit [Bacteroidales bacterium]|nr:efflux RND transporter periplasmic adaptor subunit [Bacteroidales bacterium]
MKKKYIGIGIILIAAVAVGYYVMQSRNKTALELITQAAVIGKIESVVTATGTIQPVTSVEVGTQVSGIVERIFVDFNSEVKKGDTIAELDKSTLKTALQVARANYQTAQNNVQYNRTVYERQKALFDQQMISQADFDEAKHTYTVTLNSLTQAQSDLEKAQTNLSYATIISPINGVVLSRAVDVGQTVAASLNTPTLFTIAQDLTQIQVEANVDEADIGKVKMGQTVSFTVDAYPNSTFDGEVQQIRLNPIVTSNVVTYTIIIKSENEQKKLMPGMTATVTIYTQQIFNTLVAPIAAINFTPTPDVLTQYYAQHKLGAVPDTLMAIANKVNEGLQGGGHRQRPQGAQGFGGGAGAGAAGGGQPRTKTVWIALPSQHLQVQKVEIGVRDGINVQILSGLKEGDLLVTDIREPNPEQTTAKPTGSPFAPQAPRGAGGGGAGGGRMR